MSDVPPAQPTRKLPVEIVVRRAFLFSWESRHILLPPFLIYATLTILAEVLVSQIGGADDHRPIYILTAIEQIFAMAFAVGIHRYVLLGEAPAGFGFFRWDRHFVRYVLVTILLFILGVLAAVPTASVASGVGPGGVEGMGGATVFFGMATLFLAASILVRLALLLPSAAIGDETRAKTIWGMTQGNSFRLIAATLMTVLPFLIVQAALLRLMPENGGGAIEILVTIAVGLVSPAQLITLTVLLALCYDLLVRGNGPVVTDSRNI
jgi:hypothetical protein